MKKLITFGPAFIIIAALLWSFDGILRISLYSLPSAVIVFYEHLIGLIILVFVAFNSLRRDLPQMSRREWVAIAVVALFSGALGTIFYTSALQYVQYSQYSVVVLLQQLQPIWAIAMAAILLREKVTAKFVILAVLALLSAYFITFRDLQPNLATGAGTAMAGLFGLLAGVVWGSSTAISKLVLNKISFLSATALRFFLAPIFALLFVFGQHQSDALFKLTGSQVGTLFIIALSTGMVALLFYYYGLKRTPARVTTLCELVWPASAIFIDYFHYDKSLSFTQILGVAVLVYVIYKVTTDTAESSVYPVQSVS